MQLKDIKQIEGIAARQKSVLNNKLEFITSLSDKNKFKKNWLKIVERVKASYDKYLESMKGKEIKYIIISEATLLKFLKDTFLVIISLIKRLKMLVVIELLLIMGC